MSYFSPPEQTGFFYHRSNQGLNMLMIKNCIKIQEKRYDYHFLEEEAFLIQTGTHIIKSPSKRKILGDFTHEKQKLPSQNIPRASRRKHSCATIEELLEAENDARAIYI